MKKPPVDEAVDQNDLHRHQGLSCFSTVPRCRCPATGVVFAVLHPPMLTSTAAVLLQQPPQSVQAATSNGVPDPYMATQEVIADSNPVLLAALPDARPAMSLAELRGDLQIRSVTNRVITVSAKGRVAADA
jgi:hypothetical protein